MPNLNDVNASVALQLERALLGPDKYALSCGCVASLICTFPGEEDVWLNVRINGHVLNCAKHIRFAGPLVLFPPWGPCLPTQMLSWISTSPPRRISVLEFHDRWDATVLALHPNGLPRMSKISAVSDPGKRYLIERTGKTLWFNERGYNR